MANKHTVPPTRRRPGRTPDIHRKSGPMRDRTKYNRKSKHKEKQS